jgi:hypothetical protein
MIPAAQAGCDWRGVVRTRTMLLGRHGRGIHAVWPVPLAFSRLFQLILAGGTLLAALLLAAATIALIRHRRA